MNECPFVSVFSLFYLYFVSVVMVMTLHLCGNDGVCKVSLSEYSCRLDADASGLGQCVV